MVTEIRGRLDTTRLTEVFDLLTEGDRTWSLLVSDGLSEKLFYFSIGGIRMVAQGGRGGRSTVDVLADRGKLDRESRRRLEEHASAGGLTLGDAARDLKIVSREEIEEAVRQQLLEEFFDICLWKDAEYEFLEGQPSPRFYDTRERACSVSCEVPKFVAAVREHWQRWRTLAEQCGSEGGVLVLTDRGRRAREQDQAGAASQVLRLVDGRRSVEEIIAQSNLPGLSACEALFELQNERFVRRSVAAAATGPRNREELLLEVRQLEASRTALIGDLIVRRRLVRAYVELGEKEKAAAVLREVVRLDRSRGDLRAVLESLRQIASLVPEDFTSREQIVDLLRELNEVSRMVEEGRGLAEALFRHNLLNRARRVLERLLAVAPGDRGLRRLYALTLMGMGLDERALEELRALAELLEKANAPVEELREVYRRILALDGGQKVWRRKLRNLGASRRTIWLTRAGFAAAILLLIGGVGSFFYEKTARDRYEEERETITRLVAERRFEAARRRAQAFRHRYPFSSTDRRALEFLGRIDDLEAEYLKSGLVVEMKAAERAAAAGDAKTAREIYQRVSELDAANEALVVTARERLAGILSSEKTAGELVMKARQLVKKAKYEDAIRIYDDVRSLYPLTDAAVSIRYPAEIETIPSEARVFLNGEEMSPVRPVVVVYSPREKNRLRAEAAGFEPLVVDIDAPLPARTVLTLRKSTRWVFTGEGPFEAPPLVHGDRVFIAGRDQWLYCLSVETGQEQFRVSLGLFGDCGVSVAAVGGLVVAGTARGEAVAVDVLDGRIRWRRKVGESVSADLVADAGRSRVLVTESRGTVLAIDAVTGAVAWSSGIAAAPSSAAPPSGARVFVGSYDRRGIVALDAADGSESWSFPVPAPVAGSPAPEGESVFFGTEDGGVYAVGADGTGGARLFAAGTAVKAPPVRFGDSLYVASLEGKVLRRRLDGSGTGDWDVSLGAVMAGGVAVCGDCVYAGTTGGRLHCLERETGKIRWVFSTGGKIVARPVVRDGTVYLASMDGRLYAIAE